tara:strand:+ start:97890 stop:98963 length:1074 start_codon:yes stop_codon:yes gene_type:complete
LQKTILIAPLNWGLGHATRCIPIINALVAKGHTIIIASDGVALELLTQEYPNLITETLPSYHIRYPKKGSLFIKLIQQVPGILRTIQKEKSVLENLIDKHRIDVVISDNRYGMYNANVKSIYLSHQLKVAAPFAEHLLARLQAKFLRHFDEIWVPDIKEKINLSGKLGHYTTGVKPVKFIGTLSRFSNKPIEVKPKGIFQPAFILAVISGPEPQRTIFEKLVIKEFSKLPIQSVVVGGSPNGKPPKFPSQITYFDFLQTAHLKWLLTHAQTIISRAGYSTIMDLVYLQKKAILIPTPGQTEQEYLAKHLAKSGLFYSMSQNHFDIQKALSELEKTSTNPEFLSQSFTMDLSHLINTI